MTTMQNQNSAPNAQDNREKSLPGQQPDKTHEKQPDNKNNAPEGAPGAVKA